VSDLGLRCSRCLRHCLTSVEQVCTMRVEQ
jgi:hypothetical protein